MKTMHLNHVVITMITLVLSLIVTALFLSYHKTLAQSSTPPYDTIEITMYRLSNNGSILPSEDKCGVQDISYGCTAKQDGTGSPYPFGTENPVTLKLESDNRNGKEQGYIHNVTAHELGIHTGSQGNKSFASIQAQAIAVRSYVYQRHANSHPVSQGGYGPINNSNQFQVYLPYFYDEVLESDAQRNRLNDAVRPVIYLTEQGKQQAIEALFGADNGAFTSKGEHDYLQRIYDPISAPYGTLDGTGNGGMSSKGASRWGFGHTSSLGSVAKEQSNYPHDSQGDGDFWPVRWDTAQQILAHYYTGINFVGLNPDPPDTHRFNILDIQGLPDGYTPDTIIQVNAGDSISGLTIVIQNTGVFAWGLAELFFDHCQTTDTTPTRLSYHLYQGSRAISTGIERYGLCYGGIPENSKLLPGKILILSDIALKTPSNIPSGKYRLRLDLEIYYPTGNVWVSDHNNTNHWPTQDILICVDCSDDNPPGGSIPAPEKDDDKSTTEGEQAYNSPITIAWQPVEGADEYDYDYELKEGSGSLDAYEPIGQEDSSTELTFFPDAVGTHVICVRAVKDGERSEATCYHYDIRHLDTQAPTVTLNQPSEAIVNHEFSLEWSVSDVDEWGSGTGIERVELYQAVGNNQWSYITTFIPDEPQSHWITDRTPCQWHKLKLVARDEVGNRSEVEKEVYVRCDQPVPVKTGLSRPNFVRIVHSAVMVGVGRPSPLLGL